MQIESIKVSNYRVFHNIEVNHIPNLAIFYEGTEAGKRLF